MGARFLRFAVVGIINTLVDAGAFAFFLWVSPARGPVAYGIFNVGAFLLAAFTSYQLNRRWTWRDRLPRPIPFMIVTLTAAGLSSATVAAFTVFLSPLTTRWLRLLMVAKGAAMVVSAATNFFGYHFWAFARPLTVTALPPRMPAPSFSLVLPAYREEDRLPVTLASLDRWMEEQPPGLWEVWVADDGSDDGTSQLVEEAQEARPWLGLVRLHRHGGKGAALREAFQKVRGQYVVYTDADLSYSWSDVEKVADRLREGDVVAAQRVAGAPATLARRFIHRSFMGVLSLLGLRVVHDPQCGLKGYRREALQKLLPRCRMNGFGFDLETLLAARGLGLSLDTLDIEVWRDVPGSKVRSLRHGLDTLQSLAVILARRWAGAYGSDPSKAMVRLGIVAFAGFSFLFLFAIKVWQWEQWLISAYDGGLYMQALWLTGHGLWNAFNFYTSQPNLADANQWLLIPMGYLSRLGGPLMAFALQALAGALLVAAVVVYSRDRGEPVWAAFLYGAITFLHPAAFGTQVLDWHPDPMGVAALAWAWVLARRDRSLPYFIAILLSLATKNQAAVAVGATGAMGILVALIDKKRRLLFYGAWTLGLAIVFLLGNEWATRLLGGSNLNVAVDYRSLGGSVEAVILNLLTHPSLLFLGIQNHPGYWVDMLRPLLGLPLLAPILALPGLSVMLLNSLSDHPSLTVPYVQYSLWALPALMFATIEVISAIRRKAKGEGKGRAVFFRQAATALLVWVSLFSLWSFLRFTLPNEVWRLNPVAVREDLQAAASLIPEDAAVLGEPGTITPLSWRRYSGAWPHTDMEAFLEAVPQNVPIFVLVAPGKAFGGMAVAKEMEWIQGLVAAGAEVVMDRNGVLLLRVR